MIPLSADTGAARGTDGIIAYAEVNPDYTQRPDPVELLPVLDKLRVAVTA